MLRYAESIKSLTNLSLPDWQVNRSCSGLILRFPGLIATSCQANERRRKLMQPPFTLALGGMFMLLAIANACLMLRGRQTATPAAYAWRARTHRFIGYLFLFIYCTMMYFMVLRLKGVSDELPPRILIHAFLALMLLPLLVAKVIVARYYKDKTAVLSILGLLITGLTSLLVIMSVGAYLLKDATSASVSWIFSAIALTSIAVALSALLLRRPRASSRKPASIVGQVATGGRDSVILQLVRVERQTKDAKTLCFRVPQEHRLSFRPGQFMTFRWPIDGQTVPRCYSICSSPTQTGYIEITPKRSAKGYVSVFLNERAGVGLTVEASQPAGRFCFDEREHRRIVLIAGGSGITPFMSMLRYIDDRCLATEVTLLYFVRTRNDIIFQKELELLQNRLQRFHWLTVISDPDPLWSGPSGHLTREMIEINLDDIASSTFFLCGPPGMMQAARDLLESMGVTSAQIKQESFGSAPANTPASDNPVLRMTLVEFVRSNQTRTASSTTTLLETAEACGIRLPYSCRQGQCGTCATKLLDGRVHMDCEDGLTPELKEQGFVLPCVSRAQGDVKIDA